jgi:hypothetical protein
VFTNQTRERAGQTPLQLTSMPYESVQWISDQLVITEGVRR